MKHCKIEYNSHKLVQDLPAFFKTFFDYLTTLKYETCPDYDSILEFHKAAIESAGGF